MCMLQHRGGGVADLQECHRDAAPGDKIDVADELKVEDKVWVKVLTVDVEQQRIGLRCRPCTPTSTSAHPRAALPASALPSRGPPAGGMRAVCCARARESQSRLQGEASKEGGKARP